MGKRKPRQKAMLRNKALRYPSKGPGWAPNPDVRKTAKSAAISMSVDVRQELLIARVFGEPVGNYKQVSPERIGATLTATKIMLGRAWKGPRHNGYDHFHPLVLKKGERYKLTMFFFGNEFFFFEENRAMNAQRTSIWYMSREKAQRAYDLGVIRWREWEPFNGDKTVQVRKTVDSPAVPVREGTLRLVPKVSSETSS